MRKITIHVHGGEGTEVAALATIYFLFHIFFERYTRTYSHINLHLIRVPKYGKIFELLFLPSSIVSTSLLENSHS